MRLRRSGKYTMVDACAWPPMVEECFRGSLPTPVEIGQIHICAAKSTWTPDCAHCVHGMHPSYEKHDFEAVTFATVNEEGDVLWWVDWKQHGYQEGPRVPDMQEAQPAG